MVSLVLDKVTLAAASVANTSTHDWLERRGETIYLIHMIDDATSELTALFVRHDSTEENMRMLRQYLERHGRPVAFYTDKASLFQTAPKNQRESPAVRDATDLPPTQIGRALRELSVVWIGAHSPTSMAASTCKLRRSRPIVATAIILSRRRYTALAFDLSRSPSI
jgi:hypothetical protein